MARLEEVFERIKQSKKEQREIKTVYRDALATSQQYQDIADKLIELKEKKKQVEENIKSQFKSELNQLERIKEDIASDNELISDMAITKLMKGETVKITDEYENEYEPVFRVSFKKSN